MNLEYKIPKDILSRIPDYFWDAFAGELSSVFGPCVFQKDEEGDAGVYNLLYFECTVGWQVAFNATCRKLNMVWLDTYYQSLDWMESDLFDAEIGDAVVEKFIKADNTGTQPYYRYLLKKG